MMTSDWLAVTSGQTLRFFFERLKDVSGEVDASSNELLYNASVLAHFASTSTASADVFPATPASLSTVFDLFVLDRSHHADPELAEAAAAQCLLLTGFFQDQLRRRHNVEWYASLGAGFYEAAAQYATERPRAHMMATMARKFELWRVRQHRLATELRDEPRLLRGVIPEPPSIM
jgi:hypothetical protein